MTRAAASALPKKRSAWTDSRYGTAAWTLFAAWCFYDGQYGLAMFGAFWSGVSIDRWLSHAS